MCQISIPNYNQSHPTASCKRNRNRGVVLSKQGWQKLIQAHILHDKQGNRYTFEKLSERSGLNDRTVSRILSCEVRVDKRTLKTFFAAFGLILDKNDYTTIEYYSTSQAIADTSLHLNLPIHAFEAGMSYQELIELYHQLVQSLKYLSQILNLDETVGNVHEQRNWRN